MARRWLVLGVAAVALMTAAGCGGGGGDAGAPPSTSPPVTVSSPTTTAVLSEEEAVLAAYQGYWDTWLAANDPPNPDHPDLAKYYTGRTLERARSDIAEKRAIGQAIRLPAAAQYRHDAHVAMLSGDQATVVDCSIDDSQLVDARSGLVLNDAVATERLVGSLVRTADAWRVELVTRTAAWDGAVGCEG